MSIGEALTRATIWAALAAYFGGTACQLATPSRREGRDWKLALWNFGCAAYLIHIICAFQFYHHWSHRAAWEHTAEVTGAMTGLNSGAGLYVNYAFTLGWVMDAVWWASNPAAYFNRPRWLAGLWSSFMFFIVFNATVVFGHGPVRWLGLAGCLAIIYLAVRRKVRIIQ